MSDPIISKSKYPGERIVRFIQEHHVMTLATSSGDNIPWCASCFYAYEEEKNWFIFTSDDDTRHGAEMSGQPVVAACIALETGVTGRIRGIQVSGNARKVSPGEESRATAAYLKRFPIAMLMKTNLWILEPEHIKMTDNRLGFGKKLLWYREENDKDPGNS